MVKKTSIVRLALFAMVGLAAGWALELSLTSSGSPIFQLHWIFSIAVLLIALVILGLSIPIRSAVRAENSGRINPFYAYRVLILAQASAYVAAIFAGFAAGIVLWITTRSIVVGELIWSNGLALVAALVLLAAALVSERFCRLPNDKNRDTRLE